MTKGTRYKRQVITVDMSYEASSGTYTLDEEIKWYSKRVTHVTMYTKDSKNISYKNCRMFEPLKINEKEIYPEKFDTELLYPIPGSDCEKYQKVNIPIENGSRLKGRFTNLLTASELIIVLQLETN